MTLRIRSAFIGLVTLFAAVFGTAAAGTAQAGGPPPPPASTLDNTIWG